MWNKVRTNRKREGTSLMHMKIASILMIALMLASAVPAAFAATTGTSALDGNPPATLEITITGSISAWSLAVGANEDTTSVNMNVKSNVAWDVKVSDELDGTKQTGTEGYMTEYDSGTTTYTVASWEQLANAIQLKEVAAGSYVTPDAAGVALTLGDPTVTAGSDFDIGIQQVIEYGDKRLVAVDDGDVYRIVVTFTISASA